MVTSDWAGNKTYVMEFDWSKGKVGEKMELADVEWPTKIKMTSASKSTERPEHNIVKKSNDLF